LDGATISSSPDSASSLVLQSKEDGSAIFTDVKAGDYRFTVGKEGFGTLTFQVTLRQGESLNLGQIELTRRANVTSALIQGQVTDKTTGQAVVGAQVKLVSGTNTLTATTNAEGRYQITLAQPAAFTLSVVANGYVAASGSGTVTAGSTSDFSPQLTSEQAYIGNVTGKVTDGGGTALTGVSILKNGVVVGQTDTSGQFILDKTSAGSFTLTFEKANYQGPSVNVNLPVGQTANIGTVQLFAQDPSNPTQSDPALAKGIFEIDVINSVNNKFIQNPTIIAEKLDSNNQVLQSHTFTTTNTLTAELSVGKWRITASHPDYQPAVSTVKILDANQTQKVELKLVLLPYQIKGKVVDSLTNRPVSNAIVNVYKQDNGQILQTLRTDIDGLFKTNNISNDLLIVEVQSTVYLKTSRSFDKQYGSNQLIDLGEFRLRPLSAEVSLPDLKVMAVNTNDLVTDQQNLQMNGVLKASISNVGTNVFTKTQEVEVVVFADTNNNRIFDENEIILGHSSLEQNLKVQENIELSIDIHGNSLFKDAPIAVWVDSKKQVAELNEDNNIALSYENKIFNQTVTHGTNKQLNTAWNINNLSILTQPLIVNIADANSNQLSESKILFIDNNGKLNLVSGTDGRLEWSLNLNLSTATGQASEKLNFSKRNGLIYVSDVKNKKILRIKTNGQVDGEISLNNYNLQSIPFILNDYNRDGVDDIITPIGVYDEKKKVWISFNYNGLNIVDSDIHAFYSKKYNDNLYLVSNVIFDSTGNILKKSNGSPVYNANSQPNSIFAVVNLIGDQDPEIIKRTCTGNTGYSQIEIYSLEQERTTLTLSGGDCRFKEDFVVADFDGDSKPDFYVDGRVYRNDGSILFSLNRNQFESLNGSTFNFDNDSNFDLVINRSGKLIVYDGKTGQERYFLNLPISSNSPKPLIADVNADGIADIIVGLNGASCTDSLPFTSASLPSADVKVVIRWSGGPDLDINTQFNNVKYGWSFNNATGNYIRWLGDNTNGGPEYVFLSSSEAKAKGLLDQEDNLILDLGSGIQEEIQITGQDMKFQQLEVSVQQVFLIIWIKMFMLESQKLVLRYRLIHQIKLRNLIMTQNKNSSMMRQISLGCTLS
ncbi:MAG: carboxypeptidase regulatory-like domain-containing protein, partial [Carnobacterium sp.]